MTISTSNVTTSIANVFVGTGTGNTAITYLSLTNYTASSVNANIYVVPSGNTVGNLNIAVANIQITPNDTYQFYVGNEKLIVAAGDSIQVNASANNSVAAIISYTLV